MPPQQDDIVVLDGVNFRVQYINSKGKLDLRAEDGSGGVMYGIDASSVSTPGAAPPPAPAPTADAGGPSGTRPRRDTDSLMDPLAAAVAEAEKLEAQGKIREAAELVARVMMQTKADYIKASPKQPQLDKPAGSAAAPKKGAIDWNRLQPGPVEQRCAPWLPQEDEEGEGESDDEPDQDEAAATAAQLDAAELEFDAPQAPTLERKQRDGSSSTVELTHTCPDGRKIPLLFQDPAVPPRMVHAFNKEAKHACRDLRAGGEAAGREFSHKEIALWLITCERLSKNKIGDYLGRSDDDAVACLDAFVGALDFKPFLFDEAMRFFLSLFRLPGEAQQARRLAPAPSRPFSSSRPTVSPSLSARRSRASWRSSRARTLRRTPRPSRRPTRRTCWRTR